MSLAAVPAYLWARSVVSTRSAVLVAALTLALPAFAYSGLLMTETVFYPLLVLVCWVAALTIVSPTRRNQLLLVGLVAAAVLTRLQAGVLVLVFPTAALLAGVGLRAAPRRFAVTFVGFGGDRRRLARLEARGGRRRARRVHRHGVGRLPPDRDPPLRLLPRRRPRAPDRFLPGRRGRAALVRAARAERRGAGGALGRDGAVALARAPGRRLRVALRRPRGRAGHDRRRAATLPLPRDLARGRRAANDPADRCSSPASRSSCMLAWPLHTLLAPAALPDGAGLIPFHRLGHERLLLDGGLVLARARADLRAARAFSAPCRTCWSCSSARAR